MNTWKIKWKSSGADLVALRCQATENSLGRLFRSRHLRLPVIAVLGVIFTATVSAEITGTLQGSHYASGDTEVTGGKTFVQKAYSLHLNPSLELIAGSEDNLGIIIGNRHGNSDKHLGYFVGFEKQGDFQDITAILEGNYNKTGAYVRGHAGDLANGADVGVRQTLVDKRLQIIAELAGHFYDTERVGSVSAGSIGLEADLDLGKNWSLFANARGLSDEKLTGENYSINAGLRYSIGGKRDSFNRMPADLGLDLQHMDLGYSYVPVHSVNSSGVVEETYVSRDEFNSGVNNGTIAPSSDGSSGTSTNPVNNTPSIYDNDSGYTDGPTTITGGGTGVSDNTYDLNDSDNTGTSTSGGNTGGDPVNGGGSGDIDLT